MPSSVPAQRFQDIVDNIRSIEDYVEGMTQSDFAADPRTRDAVERCLERISEAASKLGALASSFAPDQPWNRIRGIGNRLRHEYDRVDANVLWDTVSKDLIPLQQACERVLEQLRTDE